MKIIIHNHSDQYALSRRQLECIKEILPKEYFQPIREFRLLDDHRNLEVFEYSHVVRIVWFSLLIKAKTQNSVKKAVEELLVGLARIKSKSKFYHPLKESERNEYMPFVQKWLPRCLEAIHKIKK